MAEALVGTIFAVWLVATLAAAVDDAREVRHVRRADLFGLIPSWNFFAPRPGVYDYHLLARVRHDDGSVGRFSEIAAPATSRWRWIWHPSKRLRKMVFSCCEELRKNRTERGTAPEYSSSYLMLLNLAGVRLRAPGAESVQFMLVRSSPQLEEPELIVRSRFHPLPG